MILNTFAVVDAFVTLLRLPLALLVIALGVAGWLRLRRPVHPEDRKALEDRTYLLSLLGLLLLGLNLVSWPLLYLLLQSYVSEWPGVMCIYGVTQVGAGSSGISRFLPILLAALQTLKPLLVFASGAWFVLYLLNRRTQTGPLLGRLFLVLAAFAVLTVADASAELAYLGIPKKEESLSTGCCTGAFEEAPAGFWGTFVETVANPAARPWLFTAYYAANLVMLAALLWCSSRAGAPLRPILVLTPLLLGASVALLAGAAFLVEVAAPKVLHLEYHHCPYDLIPRAPDVMVGVALFLWGTFSVGWACVAGWLAWSPETRPFLPAAARQLLFMAFCCYLGSVVLISLDLALA
jgi:hypothetical protein